MNIQRKLILSLTNLLPFNIWNTMLLTKCENVFYSNLSKTMSKPKFVTCV